MAHDSSRTDSAPVDPAPAPGGIPFPPTAAPDPADPLALESQICFALSVASRSVIAAYRPVLEPLRLTHPQYLVMLALWEHGPMSLKTLGGLLSMDSGTLSPLVKRLEALDYVSRTRNPEDERALLLELTPAGAALRVEAEKIPTTMKRTLGVTDEELLQLHAMMSRLIWAADGA